MKRCNADRQDFPNTAKLLKKKKLKWLSWLINVEVNIGDMF